MIRVSVRLLKPRAGNRVRVRVRVTVTVKLMLRLGMGGAEDQFQ